MAKKVKQPTKDRPTECPSGKNVLGSCCYYDETKNKAICEDGITCPECKKRNNGDAKRWNKSRCNQRISRKDDLCCNTCSSRKSDSYTKESISKIRQGKKAFRSRLNEGVINLSPSVDEICLSEPLGISNSCDFSGATGEGFKFCYDENEDTIDLINRIRNEKCEACQRSNDQKITPELRRYYGCLCVLNQEKQETFTKAYQLYACDCTGLETSQEQTKMSIEINKLIISYRKEDIICSSLLPENDSSTVAKKEKEEGCCCHYTIRSEGNYNVGDLRKCLPLTRRQCEKVKGYRTIWTVCEECNKTCVLGNRPGRCSSCDPFSGATGNSERNVSISETTRSRVTQAQQTVSSPQRSTPPPPSPPQRSSPSSPSSPPSTGYGY
jgi:hypothetical protein